MSQMCIIQRCMVLAACMFFIFVYLSLAATVFTQLPEHNLFAGYDQLYVTKKLTMSFYGFYYYYWQRS